MGGHARLEEGRVRPSDLRLEAFHPMGLYQCGDGGWICIGAASRDQWENFCITTDTVELMADDTLYAPAVRFDGARVMSHT